MHGHGKYFFRVQGDVHEESPLPAAALLPASCTAPPPAPLFPAAHNCSARPAAGCLPAILCTERIVSCAVRVWQGEYVHGVREGKGKLTKADGTVIEGVWKAGELQQGV